MGWFDMELGNDKIEMLLGDNNIYTTYAILVVVLFLSIILAHALL